MSDSKAVQEFNSLNEKRSEVIEEIMKLRLEQAKLKTQMIKIASGSNDTIRIADMVRCW